MRMSFVVGWNVLAAGLLLAGSGCFLKKSQPKPAFSNPPGTIRMTDAQGRVLTTSPGAHLAGKVVKVNPASQFVVLTFPIGKLPVPDQRLYLYRNGLKTAEVVVTGPVLDDNIVADIVAGSAGVGDEARTE
jgi:hypothetical protein